LKDRIQSQILTHYPKTIDESLAITEQEANILEVQKERVAVSDLVKRLVEQVAFEARNNEYVDKKSGVSARLTIAAYENLVSSAERRAIINNEKRTQVWISDLVGVIPSVTGKIELVYEGEQEGPYQVAVNLIDKALRNLFVQYFPNPEQAKKKIATGKKNADEMQEENPYKQITTWFNSQNHLDLLVDMKDEEKIQALYKVDGLYGLVKKYFHAANDRENALLMEFVLHGLSAYSLISKKFIEGKIEFKDLMGSMMNFGDLNFTDDELNEDDFR
jgi:magnesium chelatase subunit I